MNHSRTSAKPGFTLIETLVALVIATIAATVVLKHVHTLMQRAEKEQSHQLAALQLLNDSLRLSHGGLANARPPKLENDRLLIEADDQSLFGLPLVEVHNFSVRNEALPPIVFAYTPFQSFSVKRDRYAIVALAPAVKTPAGVNTVPDNIAPSSEKTDKRQGQDVPKPGMIDRMNR